MSQKANSSSNTNFKIGRADRLMAIKRKDEFKKDYEELKEIRLTGDENCITQKEYEIYNKWGESVFAIEMAEDLYLEDLPSVQPVASIHEHPITKFMLGEGEEEDRGKWKITAQELLNDGERLYLKVDIRNYSKDKIMQDIKEIICHYKKAIKDATRNNETTHDHWEIYDLKHDNGLSIIQIAKKFSGIDDNPAYNVEVDKEYRKVKRAYEKACSIMNSISPNKF